MLEEDLEGGDGVVKETWGFDGALVVLAVGAAEGAMERRVGGAMGLATGTELLGAAADFAAEVAEGCEVVAGELGGLGGIWGRFWGIW